VAELGDGILGEYGVQDILHDAELMRLGAAYVMAAPDPVACWGAAELMQREYGLPITAITGPATDNEVGNVYITVELGLAAHNARMDAAGLIAAVREALAVWEGAGGSGRKQTGSAGDEASSLPLPPAPSRSLPAAAPAVSR
jgi:hypothetical protein